jgi:hypothetical protein
MYIKGRLEKNREGKPEGRKTCRKTTLAEGNHG